MDRLQYVKRELRMLREQLGDDYDDLHTELIDIEVLLYPATDER